MTEAARATARTRTRPGARFRRLAHRSGKGHDKKAATTAARTLIGIAWAVIARGQDYADAGEDYYHQRDQRNREHLIRHRRQALARLGCPVTLVPPGDGSPPGPCRLTASPPHRQPHSRLRRRRRVIAGVPDAPYMVMTILPRACPCSR